MTDIDERYGRTRNRNIDRIIVGSTLAVVLIGVILWAVFGGWGGNASTIEFQDVGFEIEGNEVLVKYEVSAPANTEVACALASMSESYATVAWKVVVLEPSQKHTRRFTETLIAVREPNSGFVSHCWAPEE